MVIKAADYQSSDSAWRSLVASLPREEQTPRGETQTDKLQDFLVVVCAAPRLASSSLYLDCLSTLMSVAFSAAFSKIAPQGQAVKGSKEAI